MRRQHFEWTFVVLALVLTIYGAYSVIYNVTHQKDIALLGLIFLMVGSILLIIYLVLFVISFIQRKNNKAVEEEIIDAPVIEKVEEKPTEEPKREEIKEEPKVVEEEVEEETEIEEDEVDYSDEVDYVYEYEPVPPRRTYDRTVYVSKSGYGVVLRVTGSEILDMRTNTYYVIEGNMVKKNGYGPVYEISGNRIRSAFGSYLYEISGSNVNKVFGGFYASISGNSIQVHDLSARYEMSSSLSLNQQLAVVALLFGTY